MSLAACSNHIAGLRGGGTVVATGGNELGQCDVSDWTNIIAIAAGNLWTIGLKADGTILSTKYKGYSSSEDIDVSDWLDIVVQH